MELDSLIVNVPARQHVKDRRLVNAALDVYLTEICGCRPIHIIYANVALACALNVSSASHAIDSCHTVLLMVGFHVGYRQKSRNVAKKIEKNGLARRNLLEILPIILLEVVMVPNRVGISPSVDINKDGRPDAVLFRTSTTMMKAHDKKGRKITISEQSSEMRPVLATESTGIYAPFHTQDRCKADEDFARIKAGTYKDDGIFWRYASADIPFAATNGGTPFYVGQSVLQKGQAKPQVIESFRVGLQVTWGSGAPVISFGPVEALFAGCRAVALDQVVPSQVVPSKK